MENHILQQSVSLGTSMVLGLSAACLYDLFRAIRIRRRRSRPLTHFLDALYVLILLLLALWLATAIGGGVLRLYMLTGAAAGALLWWLWPSRLLRPAWDFWMDALAAFFCLLCRPLIWSKNFMKRVFSFLRKYVTITDTDNPQEESTREEETPQ